MPLRHVQDENIIHQTLSFIAEDAFSFPVKSFIGDVVFLWNMNGKVQQVLRKEVIQQVKSESIVINSCIANQIVSLGLDRPFFSLEDRETQTYAHQPSIKST